MYLTRAEVAQLLTDLRDYFTRVDFCADIFDSATMGGRSSRSVAITASTGAHYTFAVDGTAGLAALTRRWVVRVEVDVMSRVSRAMRGLSKAFQLGHRGRLMYGVALLEAVE